MLLESELALLSQQNTQQEYNYLKTIISKSYQRALASNTSSGLIHIFAFKKEQMKKTTQRPPYWIDHVTLFTFFFL